MKRRIFSLLTILILATTTHQALAQCSVCRIGAESNVEHGYSAGKGLNKGILYLMAVPYVLVGAGFYIIYKKRKEKENHSS
ncbi:MAG: hypothetical protein JSS90_03415 [Bacteroidetes bacterium]|jgi:Mn2+/Fe2+ NRAMP family transporter|nr:hypothetical protein [Bacteroidota bacterium]